MRTLLLLILSAAALSAEVSLFKLPDSGLQPQCIADEKGTIHVIYFKGEAGSGDLFYAKLAPGAKDLTSALRVNSTSRSAIAAGTIRGGQLALGKKGRVHVAWNGGGGAAGFFYARLNDAGDAFEPQRNLMQFTGGLDGGGSVAADAAGNVYAVWHGWEAAGDETTRRVWVTRSADGGKTFSREAPVDVKGTGACGCCGLKAFAGRTGNVYILYRAATESVHRDMHLLVSKDHGAKFKDLKVYPWELRACPMSSASIVEGAESVYLAWETDGQVYCGALDPTAQKISRIFSPPGEAKGRKHPFLSAGPEGEVLLAWTVGTGWKKGGGLSWQLFSRDGVELPEKGTREGVIPVWGSVAVSAMPVGGHTIFY